jgi:hypothetical protein
MIDTSNCKEQPKKQEYVARMKQVKEKAGSANLRTDSIEY